jgi:hypothetical protein
MRKEVGRKASGVDAREFGQRMKIILRRASVRSNAVVVLSWTVCHFA